MEWKFRLKPKPYTLNPKQSLDSIARSLGMEVLSLYMFNPFLERPEHITPGLLGYMYTQTDSQTHTHTHTHTHIHVCVCATHVFI